VRIRRVAHAIPLGSISHGTMAPRDTAFGIPDAECDIMHTAATLELRNGASG